MDVTDTGDGVHGSFAAENDPALVDERLVEPSAQHLHGEKTAGSDAPDHPPKLVHVGVDHDARTGLAALGGLLRDDRAEAVVMDRLGGVGLHLRNHDGADRLLKAGWSRRICEALQHLLGAIWGLLRAGRNKDEND